MCMQTDSNDQGHASVDVGCVSAALQMMLGSGAPLQQPLRRPSKRPPLLREPLSLLLNPNVHM